MDDENLKMLGDILIEQGLITREQLNETLEEQKVTGERIGSILVRKGWVTSEQLNSSVGMQSGYKTINLSEYILDSQVINLVPQDFALQYKIIPVDRKDNLLTVAMENPTNVFIIDELQRMTGLQIEAVMAPEMAIRRAQDEYYGLGTIQEILATIDRKRLQETDHIEEEKPIVRIVDLIIEEAVKQNASDIHLEPEEKTVSIRYRIDGLLHKYAILPKDLQSAVTSRLKILARMDIAEKRIPQDGRILCKVGQKYIDFRVSTCPTIFGENVVLRILDKSNMIIGLEKLGFPATELSAFDELIHQPYGIILVTGPTGSGKTTTLYSALLRINREDINIMTVEDPVEYQFHQIRQVQINPKAGVVFSSILRSFLRQDPDVIMVGEIRDLETAESAVQAALTGHLVLSTLHTNDAPTAFTRLTDMGIEPFLVSSSLLGVLAQRLVRKVCPHCQEPYVPTPAVIKALGLEQVDFKKKHLINGRGCRLCNKTGYKGRIGIFELMKATPEIQELVVRKAPIEEIRALARKQGMTTLRDAAISKMLEGTITVKEVLRVTQSSEGRMIPAENIDI